MSLKVKVGNVFKREERDEREGEQSPRPPSLMLAKGGMVELSRVGPSRFVKNVFAPVFENPSLHRFQFSFF
jgi:hypothetical protein